MRLLLSPRPVLLIAGILVTGFACDSRSGLSVPPDASATSTGGSMTGGVSAGGAAGRSVGGAAGVSAGGSTGGAGGASGLSVGGSGGFGLGGYGYGGNEDSCPVYVSYNPFCGQPPTGGRTIIGTSAGGGAIGVGGAGAGETTSAGGTSGTGGTTGAGGMTGRGDGGTDAQSCTCSAGTVAWDCYCSSHDCNRSLNPYVLEAGTKKDCAFILEYADCGFNVVFPTSTNLDLREVYARNTWSLVGEVVTVPAGSSCPAAPDGAAQGTLTAGQFPDASCVVSRCLQGRLADACGGADAGTKGQ